jgi:GNAT superfamily N-acetyltransferase
MPGKPPPSDDDLKRERAGTYRTRDGRFTVEQSSSGWLVLDAEQIDELGLPLARGPFPTLDGAKAALPEARSGAAPRPRSTIAPRAHRAGKLRALPSADSARTPAAPNAPRRVSIKPARPPVVIREIRAVDGDALRRLWSASGFGLLGDDDLGLARLARRNPGLVLVASEGSRVVGSALGTWDGRRGWIYHVATAPSHQRQGIATRLVEQVEAGLLALGCRKVNVMLRAGSDGGREFWAARGYNAGSATQLGKELDEG